MPEKKPVPPPAPRNRHERRKRATEERRARPWLPRVVVTTMTGEWFTHSPDCKPVFEVTYEQAVGRVDRRNTTAIPLRDYQVQAMERPLSTITSVSLVTITPEIVAKVAEKTGRTVDAVNAYLAGPEQDGVLLNAFLFFGVGPVRKVPSEPGEDATKMARRRAAALMRAASPGGLVVTGGFTRPTAPADPPPATFDAFVGSTRVETHPTCPELAALEEEEERGNMLLGMSLTDPQ